MEKIIIEGYKIVRDHVKVFIWKNLKSNRYCCIFWLGEELYSTEWHTDKLEVLRKAVSMVYLYW